MVRGVVMTMVATFTAGMNIIIVNTDRALFFSVIRMTAARCH